MGIFKKLKEKIGFEKEPVVYEYPFGKSFNEGMGQNLKELSSILKECPDDNPKYFIAQGLPETMLGHYDEAEDIFMQGYRKFPDDLEIQFFLLRTSGDKASVSKRPDLIKKSIEMWDQFIKLHPNEKFSDSPYSTADAYVERGFLKKAIGNIDGAQEDYRIAREIDPKITLPK
jgi:tetratricopeptide (TPR) repeat protein